MTLDQANMELQLVGSTAYDDEVDGMYACLQEDIENKYYAAHMDAHMHQYEYWEEQWDGYPADLVTSRSFEDE